MQIHIHQTHHSIADFEGVFQTLKDILKDESPKSRGIHLFPELFLTGYPLQDLCLQRPFIKAYQKLESSLNEFSKNLKADKGSESEKILLFGGLNYKDFPEHISNVLYSLKAGEELKLEYTKQLLPNYDIFDEKKYFTPGDSSKILSFMNYHIGALICEDMWPSSFHEKDPIQDLKEKALEQNINLDFIINLSASPYSFDKQEKRIRKAKEVSYFLNCPLVYVNRVGAVDEILFDGQSFIVDEDEVLLSLKTFEADEKTFQLEKNAKTLNPSRLHNNKDNIWDDIYQAPKGKRLPPLKDEDCESILKALTFGLTEYGKQSASKKYLVALSGGMDSALVLCLAHLAKVQVEAIYMPSKFSASLSYDLSLKLCQNLSIKLHYLPIKFLHATAQNLYKDTFKEAMEGLSDENIQSRIRGTLLYARANATDALVINTSNKSELAVGYSTLYGDSVGAISLLGDLYKTEIYQLSHYINKKYGNIIPEGIIKRAPSAELRENQEDAQSLPPYERLDLVLEAILSYKMSKEDVVSLGFDTNEVEKVFRLFKNSEYKRKQFCPIIKIKSKSFGFGHRIPLSKNSNFYLE